jgi:aminoglycoside 3-N-acetyltransferase
MRDFLEEIMYSYRDLIKAYHELGITPESQLIIHASSHAVSEITGGAETLAGSLMASTCCLITPSFTKKAMIIPPFGPEDNAISYDDSKEEESIGEPFHIELPADPEVGELAEILRRHPGSQRSNHPLLSFAGINSAELLSAQSLEEPWAPIKGLAKADGDVLLFGADHSANISIHYAELLANRKQFLRWAMWEGKVVEVPHWPGCSKGFPKIDSKLSGVVREVSIDGTFLQTIPLRDLINIAKGWILEDPDALLCDEPECQYCNLVRISNKAF